jgi:hypothetical protein
MVCEGVKQTPAKLTAEKQVPPPLKKTEVVNTLGAAGLVLAQVEGAGDCLFLSLLLQEGKITVANALRPDSATRKAVAGARTACYKMMTGTGSIEGVPAEVLRGSERLNLARNLDHFMRCGYWKHPECDGGAQVSMSFILYSALGRRVQVAVLEDCHLKGHPHPDHYYQGSALVFGARDEEGRLMMERAASKGGRVETVPTYKLVPLPLVLAQAQQDPEGWVLLYYSDNHYSPWVKGEVAHRGRAKGDMLKSMGQKGRQQPPQKKERGQQDKADQGRKK